MDGKETYLGWELSGTDPGSGPMTGFGIICV
jgi:hypothetical protein